MAFYVNAATTPMQISRTVDIAISTLVHHTYLLVEAGAVEGADARSGDTSRRAFRATDLGILAMSLLEEE